MVYNPFYIWHKELLDAMIESGQKYFVRQSFPRGKVDAPETVKHVFQISEYDELAVANHHMQIINRVDPYAHLYDITKESEKIKLYLTVENYSEYLIYSNTAHPHWKIKLKKYEPKIRNFIENRIGWKPKGKETVIVGLHNQYGSMYITFKYGRDKARYLFDELDKLPLCVTTLPYSLQLNWSPTTYQP